MKRRIAPFFLLATLLAGAPRSQNPADLLVDYTLFKEPPREYRGHFWFPFSLSNISEESVIARVQQAAKNDAHGCMMIGPGGGATTGLSEAYLKASRRQPNDKGVAYLSDEYFRLYRLTVQEGEKNNLPARVLYDEWAYPTGIVGGQFYSKYPGDAAKSLELVEKNVSGPAKVELAIPIDGGAYVGAVMMNRDTLERIDVSGQKTAQNALVCQVPKGNWKVMLFYLDPTFRPSSQKGGFVDYLDAQAVDKFIAMSYGKYYANMKEFFGSVFQMSFYDEPAMHLSNGRMWTPGFNAAFQKKHGYSPMKYYPALWYDIGPETAAARNALFGFRTQLYSDNFIGRMAAWCAEHGIDLSGHQDQEEARNPVAIHGDLMKVFEHQQIPGIDDIYYTGRSNVSYKIVASAAFNFDRPLVMAETYAAYRQMSARIAYKTAMDQYAMGVNLQIGSRPREVGPELDRFVGRMSYLLRHGRHVADVAVLYPIAALQSAYSFATPPTSNRPASSPQFYWALEGGLIPPEIDYMDLGETLYRGLRVDYTYVHPDVLEKRTVIEKGKLILDNKENREEFRVLILPGGDTISAAAARRILEFYRNGGTVVATNKLPTRSAEFKRDKDVQDMVGEVFGLPASDPVTAEIRPVVDDFKNYFANRNQAGGKSYFLPQPDIKLIRTVLKEALPVQDVEIQQAPMWPVKMGTAYDGALTYIHKVKDGRDIYFFANSQDTAVDTQVVLRGRKNLAIWNPHTGGHQKAESAQSEAGGQPVTTVRLALAPVTAVFLVQE